MQENVSFMVFFGAHGNVRPSRKLFWRELGELVTEISIRTSNPLKILIVDYRSKAYHSIRFFLKCLRTITNILPRLGPTI